MLSKDGSQITCDACPDFTCGTDQEAWEHLQLAHPELHRSLNATEFARANRAMRRLANRRR